MKRIAVLVVGLIAAGWVAADVEVDGTYLDVQIAGGGGGVIREWRLKANDHNVAGPEGLLMEGFGTGSFYAPNRRLNERLEEVEATATKRVLRYSYDCDGPYIRGFHITRTMEIPLDQTSIRVTWQVENRGTEEQWVAPWVRSDLAPGGTFDPGDRLDVPTLKGIVHTDRSAYYPAARNWVAATDPAAKESIFAVFNANEIYAFLVIHGPRPGSGGADGERGEMCGFQAVFLPRTLPAGETWETTYYLNVVRGLEHVDFASEGFAAQVRSEPESLRCWMAPVKRMTGLTLRSAVQAPNGRVWKMPGRRFDLVPNALVRSSFEWTPPDEGAYAFHGRLQQGQAPMSVGQNTGSPHESIETQFVVGNPKDTSMPAWTDTIFALDRRSHTFERTMLTAGNTAIWRESSLEKVFQEDAAKPSGRVDSRIVVSLARNEWESFQIVIRPPKDDDLRQVSFRLHPLMHESGQAQIPISDIQVMRVAYLPIEVPSHFESATGQYPDALLPFKPFLAPGGVSSPVWFSIHARSGLPAGRYTGLLEMESPDLEPIEVFIEATVFDFDLPVVPTLKTDFGYDPETAYALCSRFGYAGSLDALEAAYLENARDHRATLRGALPLPPESPDYPARLAEYEEHLDDLEAMGISTIAVPSSLMDVPEQLTLADEFVQRHALQNRAFCPLADLPARPGWPRLFERMQAWKDQAPHVPLMVTTHGVEPFLPETLDIWAVHVPVMNTINNKAILERIAAGKEVWWFVNHEPARPYANFFIDFAGVEHRILFWQALAAGITGFHYRGISVMQPGANPYERQLDITPANGDGLLVYPGPAGPVNSIRWEIIRDGLEDHDYLVLFHRALRDLQRSQGHEALLERAGKVADLSGFMPDLVNFSRESKPLLEKREAIAGMIEEMQAAQRR